MGWLRRYTVSVPVVISLDSSVVSCRKFGCGDACMASNGCVSIHREVLR